MRNLEFSGDVTIDEIFKDYKREIYENILQSINENYKKTEICEVNVVNIKTHTNNYAIKLSSDRFVSSLNRCIDFFQELEEYEKCQECVNIIREINKQSVK